LFWLSILVETSFFTGDYPCYQNAAEAFCGTRPHTTDVISLPFYWRRDLLLSKSIIAIGGCLTRCVPDPTWPVVFFLFQSLQLLSIPVAFRLSWLWHRN
jgi:hypothetical protein